MHPHDRQAGPERAGTQCRAAWPSCLRGQQGRREGLPARPGCDWPASATPMSTISCFWRALHPLRKLNSFIRAEIDALAAASRMGCGPAWRRAARSTRWTCTGKRAASPMDDILSAIGKASPARSAATPIERSRPAAPAASSARGANCWRSVMKLVAAVNADSRGSTIRIDNVYVEGGARDAVHGGRQAADDHAGRADPFQGAQDVADYPSRAASMACRRSPGESCPRSRMKR